MNYFVKLTFDSNRLLTLILRRQFKTGYDFNQKNKKKFQVVPFFSSQTSKMKTSRTFYDNQKMILQKNSYICIQFRSGL